MGRRNESMCLLSKYFFAKNCRSFHRPGQSVFIDVFEYQNLSKRILGRAVNSDAHCRRITRGFTRGNWYSACRRGRYECFRYFRAWITTMRLRAFIDLRLRYVIFPANNITFKKARISGEKREKFILTFLYLFWNIQWIKQQPWQSIIEMVSHKS